MRVMLISYMKLSDEFLESRSNAFDVLCPCSRNLKLKIKFFLALPSFALIRDDRNRNTRGNVSQDFRQSKFEMTFL